MFTVKQRVFGKASDGRTVLLYPAGATITDDEAKRAGLIPGEAEPQKSAKGLTILKEPGAESDEPAPAKPLERMRLEELRAVCGVEGVDPGGANTRAEYIAAIETARAARDRGE